MSDSKNKPTFYCPACGQKLSFLNGSVVKMVGRLHADHFSCKTMLYVPAKLGDYGAIVGEGVRIRDGARVEFECINGACKKNFTAPYDEDSAEIRMVDSDGRDYIVVFNKIFGRHATFLVDIKNKSLLASYGEDAESMTGDKTRNFFGQ